jgi:hypothetical protein
LRAARWENAQKLDVRRLFRFSAPLTENLGFAQPPEVLRGREYLKRLPDERKE